MATTQLQLRRGNKAQNDAFSGAEGELTVDIESMNLRLHSGDVTKFGGTEIPKRSDVVSATGNVTQNVNGIKTFTGVLRSGASSEECIQLRNSSITNRTTAPSSNTARALVFTANDNNGLGYIYFQKIASTNQSNMIFRTYNPNGSAYSDMTYVNKGTSAGDRYLQLPADPAGSNGTNNKQVPTIGWVNTANNGTTYSNNLVHITGTETISGQKTFSSKLYANGGVQGTASSALWADLAEQYVPDEKYPIGTLIKFGGKKDITIADDECHGVISEQPGFLLDCGLENSLPVALVGKTRVRVIGKVNKFDKLVLSNIPGVAKVKEKDDEKVIGIALKSSEESEEKLILSVVKISF